MCIFWREVLYNTRLSEVSDATIVSSVCTLQKHLLQLVPGAVVEFKHVEADVYPVSKSNLPLTLLYKIYTESGST